jgi:hypothetical protein
MNTTWGIYVEIVEGRLELLKSGAHPRELSDPYYLFLALSRDVEQEFLMFRQAWAVHLVAWPWPAVAPKTLTGAALSGETHVEISLRGGKQAETEARVRAKAADEVVAAADKVDENPRYGGMMTAADIVRGEA